jgi:DNA-binding protein HU-beta
MNAGDGWDVHLREAEGFAGLEKAKTGQISANSAQIPKKTVEIGLFPLTFAAASRMVSNDRVHLNPHESRGFVLNVASVALPHAVRTQATTDRRRTQKMATGLTKTALTRQLAEKLELTNKQSAAFLDLLAETAIKETKKNGVFVIPGIGRLVKAERKARIGRNPQTGAAIKIKAKTVVKFRVAKAAKDVIAPPKK